MLAARKPGKAFGVLAAAAILALALSGCALFKPGSLSLAQPEGIGPVSVHFELCTRAEEACDTNKTEGQSQYMLGIAIPKGASAPQTLRAESLNTGAAIAYARNEEVTQAINEVSQKQNGQPWPPPGMRRGRLPLRRFQRGNRAASANGRSTRTSGCRGAPPPSPGRSG